jgi:hypothetical protein
MSEPVPALPGSSVSLRRLSRTFRLKCPTALHHVSFPNLFPRHGTR